MGLINRLAEDRFFFFASKSRIHINTVSCGNSWEVGDHQGSWLCFSFVSHLLSLAETSEPVDKGGRNHRAQVLRDCVHQAKQRSVKRGRNRRPEPPPVPGAPGRPPPCCDTKQAFLCTPWPTGKAATRTVADARGVVPVGVHPSH